MHIPVCKGIFQCNNALHSIHTERICTLREERERELEAKSKIYGQVLSKDPQGYLARI
jgi:hypothetical protein